MFRMKVKDIESVVQRMEQLGGFKGEYEVYIDLKLYFFIVAQITQVAQPMLLKGSLGKLGNNKEIQPYFNLLGAIN